MADEDLGADVPDEEEIVEDVGEEEVEAGEEPEPEQDEEAEADEGEEPAPQPQKTSRAQERIRSLDARLKAEATQREQLQQQLQQLMARQQADQQRAQKASQEEQLALMDPAERRAFEAHQQATNTQAQLQRVQFQFQDVQDHTAFHSKAVSNPVYAKFAPQVEQALAKLRAQGMNAPRENVLAFIVGQEAIRKAQGTVGAKAKAGAQRVASAKGSPVSARSDGNIRSGGDDLSSLERRLSNVAL